jgi:UDP-glucose 4-epimerase
MRVLVTGGLGFVGSHLVDYLAESNEYEEIVVIDNLSSESSNRSYMRDDVTYWIDDIANLNTYRYTGEKFDLIYHLAALARIQPSFIDPLKYLSTDMMGTAHVCEMARSSGAKIVYAGSSSAFGGPMLNPYAFAKYTGEQCCELYSRVYDVSTVSARFFNVFGDRQPTSGSYATVVGIFEGQKSEGCALTITGNGEQRRDFTHVSDIVSGLVALSKSTYKGTVYQLGTGKNYSINELATMFESEITYIPSRPGEAWVTLADIEKTKQATGWNPTESLEDYIKEFLTKM